MEPNLRECAWSKRKTYRNGSVGYVGFSPLAKLKNQTYMWRGLLRTPQGNYEIKGYTERLTCNALDRLQGCKTNPFVHLRRYSDWGNFSGFPDMLTPIKILERAVTCGTPVLEQTDGKEKRIMDATWRNRWQNWSTGFSSTDARCKLLFPILEACGGDISPTQASAEIVSRFPKMSPKAQKDLFSRLFGKKGFLKLGEGLSPQNFFNSATPVRSRKQAKVRALKPTPASPQNSRLKALWDAWTTETQPSNMPSLYAAIESLGENVTREAVWKALHTIQGVKESTRLVYLSKLLGPKGFYRFLKAGSTTQVVSAVPLALLEAAPASTDLTSAVLRVLEARFDKAMVKVILAEAEAYRDAPPCFQEPPAAGLIIDCDSLHFNATTSNWKVQGIRVVDVTAARGQFKMPIKAGIDWFQRKGVPGEVSVSFDTFSRLLPRE